MIGHAARGFEAAYRAMLPPFLQLDRRLAICTIYSGNFSDAAFQRVASVALEHGLTIIDLRLVCNAPADYANPIETS